MGQRTWILVLPLFLLSSCFEFVEEINFESDESGTCIYTLNCSESRVKLKNIMSLDTFMNYRIPSEYTVKNKILSACSVLMNSKGISNVKKNINFEQYIFSFEFHFDSIKHLNEAINKIIKHEDRESYFPQLTVYDQAKGEFKRHQVPDDSTSSKIDKKHLGLFDGATVTSIYRFQNSVQSVTNSKAIISKNKKAVFLKLSLKDLANNPSIQSNTIKLNDQ